MCEKLFHNMDFDLFLRCLTEAHDAIDETEFMFLDDMDRDACMLGYIDCGGIDGERRGVDNHYWIGNGCDVNDGMEFTSAEALLEAKVYGGRSISEAWDEVCVLHFGYVPLDIWFAACAFSDEVYEENGIWKLRPEGK